MFRIRGNVNSLVNSFKDVMLSEKTAAETKNGTQRASVQPSTIRPPAVQSPSGDAVMR